MSKTNPLLNLSGLPNEAPDFAKIEQDHFMPAIETGIRTGKTNIAAIRDNPDAPTFENTIVAMETADEDLSTAASAFYHLNYVCGSEEMQKIAESIAPLVAAYSSEIAQDPVLFDRIKALHDKQETLNLRDDQRLLLEDSYKSFVRGGALLNDADKKRLSEIGQRLAVLSPTFAHNVQQSMESYQLHITDEARLSGLPQSAMDAAADEAKSRDLNGWVFTLAVPSYLPVVQYADDRDLRHDIWFARSNEAYGDAYDNCDVIKEIVALRHEKAQLLGYETYADYVLEERMVQSRKTLNTFLSTLTDGYLPAAKQDFETLKAFAAEQGCEDLKPWDVAYYSEKQKQSLFSFSDDNLRPYFPLQATLKGVFDHFSRLFGISFEENKAYTVWHEDVTAYDVLDEDGSFLGTLYGDFYVRKGKKPGAWMMPIRAQGLYKGEIRRPVIAIVCNYSKPTADTPSLLTHRDVLTLLHEMGHALHGMFSDVAYKSQAGTSVLWDFVELPSQLQENWGYTPEFLNGFARHYKSGEVLPDSLRENLIRARNYMVGWVGARQTSLGLLDLNWHIIPPDQIDDVANFEYQTVKEFTFFEKYGGPQSTSFSHIFAGGYSAGYYSYKWAEVLEADTFEFFEEHGLYNRDAANRYRHEILEKGGSIKAEQLYANFRGRKADPHALFRREGIEDAA